jgi:hypothetical protein
MTRIPELQYELVLAAGRRAAPRRRWAIGRRRWLAVALAALVVGGGAGAAGLAIHEGAPIKPAPAGDFEGRHHIVAPRPGTERIAATAPDPVSGPPWGLRVSRGKDGSLCVGAARVFKGRLGIYDATTRTFRALPLRGPDTCGVRVAPRTFGLFAALSSQVAGSPKILAPRDADMRLVVYGLVGSEVERLTAKGPGGAGAISISKEGGFVAVYPRAVFSDVTVTAHFRDGTTKTLGGRPLDRSNPTELARVAQSRVDYVGPPVARVDARRVLQIAIGCPADRRGRRCQGDVTLAAYGNGRTVRLGSHLIRIGAGASRPLHFRLTAHQAGLLRQSPRWRLQVRVILDPIAQQPIVRDLELVTSR